MGVAEEIAALKAEIMTHQMEIARLVDMITALERPPAVPPPPLPAEISTHHDPHLPVPGGLNVWAVRNGFWDDPQTWNAGKIPTATDRVRIPAGVIVTLDGDCVCDVLVVDGGCMWAPESERTTLTLATLFGLPSGQFVCGLDIAPFEGAFTCLFRPAPPDPLDPARYFGGLVWLGEFTVHGKAKTGSAVLLDIPYGWEVGDELIFHDTRQLGQKERAAGYNQIERRTIGAIEHEITLTKPLAFDHKAGTDDDGKPDVWPRVANLTRNVRFVAEVPGTAHVMFTSHPKVDIRFASFQGMGRTLNEPLGASNPIARYPLHFHHMHTPFHIEGVVIDGGEAPHNRKFGLVVHDTHYSTIKDCVTYNTMGHGIFQEVGNEFGNKFTGNTVIRCGGKGGRADAGTRQGGLGMQGGGFWISGPGSEWRNNYAANTESYGFTTTFFYLGRILHPDAPGSHVLVEVDGNAVGLAAFEGNTSFACKSGLTLWWLGCENQKPIEGAKVSTITDFTTVNHHEYGCFQYQVNNLVVDRFRTRGTHTAKLPGALAWYGADYLARNVLFLSADVQGQRTGFSPSAISGKGVVTWQDCLISAAAGINFSPPWTNGPRADGLDPRQSVIRNCKFRSPVKGEPFVAIARIFPTVFGSRTQNLMVLDTVRVEALQGKFGDDFEVFYAEQLPGFVPPATIMNAKYPGPKMVGSPEAGLTNEALWKKYKVAVAGAVAPGGLPLRPGIKGICAP